MLNFCHRFSLISFIAIVLIVSFLHFYLKNASIDSLVEQQTRSNKHLASVLSNTIGEELARLLSNQNMQEGLQPTLSDWAYSELSEMVRKSTTGTTVTKVKLYSDDGTTVFSTQRDEIGENQKNKQGFQKAIAGSAVSETVLKNQHSILEGKNNKNGKDLVTTYTPVALPGSNRNAVIEVYSDVTRLVKSIERSQLVTTFWVAGALAVLYFFLVFIVRRASKEIKQQYEEQKKAEKKIRYQAYHDSLTGLPNRDKFYIHIKNLLDHCKEDDQKYALMFIDLDRFKLINDSLGHDAGDHILKVASRRICESVRETDCAYRISGDDLIVILGWMSNPEKQSASVANRIIDELAKPIPYRDFEINMSASIGLTEFPQNNICTDSTENAIEMLIRQADKAMYVSKDSSDTKYCFFSGIPDDNTWGRFEIENDLKKAVNEEQFFLEYQPKIDSETGKTSSVEALLRWQHPDKGVISPRRFIPILEDTGMIGVVGNWVINEACSTVRDWIDKGMTPIRMSVNISARQFRSDNLPDIIAKAIKKHNIDPKYLELELTESMFIDNIERAIDTMQKLKEIGVSLSIDDFGSGYSSLTYLKDFPLDYLKIDKSFIQNMTTNEKDRSIAKMISALGESLKIKVIAEGVETKEQVAILREHGCHEFQGFFYGRPDCIETVEAEMVSAGTDKLTLINTQG